MACLSAYLLFFFGSETCTQFISLLVEIFGPDPDPDDIRGIVIDRACDVAFYCESLAKEGNEVCQKYAKLAWAVDPFHVRLHTVRLDL